MPAAVPQTSPRQPPAGPTAGALFDLQPTLVGDRVRLRPVAPDYFAALYTVAADPALWAAHPAHDRWQEPVFRRLFAETLASGGGLVIIDKASAAIIGSSRYHIADPAAPRAEIGWTFLARSHWGGGYNREAKVLMLRHAFRFVDMVVFRVGEGNLRSRRAVEKIGGTLSAEREEVRLPDGTPVIHVVYALSRTAFLAQPAR